MKIQKLIYSLAACALVSPAMVHASLTTSAPTGTTTVLSTVSGTYATAPSVVAGGFNVFAPSGESVWYGDSSFGLSSNGSWNNFAWVGGYCGSDSCTATIDLGGSFSSVGGFMNYATPGYGSAVISAIAADGVTVLESYALDIQAPIATSGTNDGAFRGIARSGSDIAFFRLSGSYLIAHDITIAAVPEPETYAMLLAGLGVMGAVARRRKAKQA